MHLRWLFSNNFSRLEYKQEKSLYPIKNLKEPRFSFQRSVRFRRQERESEQKRVQRTFITKFLLATTVWNKSDKRIRPNGFMLIWVSMLWMVIFRYYLIVCTSNNVEKLANTQKISQSCRKLWYLDNGNSEGKFYVKEVILTLQKAYCLHKIKTCIRHLWNSNYILKCVDIIFPRKGCFSFWNRL